MPLFRSPVKLFACSGIALLIVRLIFPPADFAGANHLRSWVRLFDFRLELTGYGFFEFVGLVFLISALIYWLILRLTNRTPSAALVQLHFWPTLLFAIFSIVLAHWVNRMPEAELNNPASRAHLNRWLFAFTWAFAGLLVFQLLFAIGAGRRLWLSRNATSKPEIALGPE